MSALKEIQKTNTRKYKKLARHHLTFACHILRRPQIIATTDITRDLSCMDRLLFLSHKLSSELAFFNKFIDLGFLDLGGI